jgi:hypothetical protein
LRLTVAGEPVAGLFPRTVSLFRHGLDPVLSRWFLPGFEWVAEHCVRLRWLQQGRLPVYLLYVFVTCAVLMAWIVLVDYARRGG